MDTAKIGHAEDLIAHVLQRHGMLVAKPKFDRDSTDLLVFSRLADGVKFCRVQCKGRTIINSTNVKIRKNDVSPSLVLFLLIDSGELEEVNLCCFFSTDIEAWKLKEENYTLSISKLSFQRKLEIYRFNSSKISLIKTIIKNAELHGEFKRLVYGEGNMEILPMSLTGFGEITSPEN